MPVAPCIRRVVPIATGCGALFPSIRRFTVPQDYEQPARLRSQRQRLWDGSNNSGTGERYNAFSCLAAPLISATFSAARSALSFFIRFLISSRFRLER